LTEPTRHLAWENFERLIERGVPAMHRVAGSPAIFMFVDERGRRIGLRSPYEAATQLPPSPVNAITVSVVTVERQRLMEVSTTETKLYPEFYSFAVSLADRIQLQNQPAITALESSLVNWNQLFQAVRLLSVESQLGLIGELWVLEGLIRRGGPDALEAWTGPVGEPHDFRITSTEFEVKTTISATRSHMINGEDQLVPSPNHKLYLLSIQVEPAGMGGHSLPDMVKGVLGLLADHPLAIERVGRALLRLGYDEHDGALYGDRWQLRNRPRLIAVDDSCPRLTGESLEALDPQNSNRISELHYRVNLEGLGYTDDTEYFQAALPIGGSDDASL
jgi:hypothetical protein